MARLSKPVVAGEKPTAARPRVSRRVVAVGGVIGTAVVAALAAAVITPERIDDFLHAFGPTSNPSSTPAVEYKRVVSQDGVFTLDIPESWLVGDSSYNIAYEGVTDSGAAMVAGVDPTDGRQPTEDGIYLASSVEAASRLGLDTGDRATIQAWADAAADEPDWSQDGCVLGASQLAGPDGWVTGVTPWDDCYSTKGLRLWEMYSAPTGGDFTLCLQLQLSSETDEAVLAHIIDSLVVDPAKIPSAGD